jgi:hypothetical protein
MMSAWPPEATQNADKQGRPRRAQGDITGLITGSLRAADEYQAYHHQGDRGGVIPSEPFSNQRHGLHGGEDRG